MYKNFENKKGKKCNYLYNGFRKIFYKYCRNKKENTTNLYGGQLKIEQ